MIAGFFWILSLMFSPMYAASTTNYVKCPNGAICKTFWKMEHECEIYYGPNCQWPCLLDSCSIIIKKHILCNVAECTPPKPNPPPSPSPLPDTTPFTVIVVCILGFLTLISSAFYFRQKIISIYRQFRYTYIDGDSFVVGETFELT